MCLTCKTTQSLGTSTVVSVPITITVNALNSGNDCASATVTKTPVSNYVLSTTSTDYTSFEWDPLSVFAISGGATSCTIFEHVEDGKCEKDGCCALYEANTNKKVSYYKDDRDRYNFRIHHETALTFPTLKFDIKTNVAMAQASYQFKCAL